MTMEISPARNNGTQAQSRLSRLHGQFKSPVMVRGDTNAVNDDVGEARLSEESESDKLLKDLNETKQKCAQLEVEIESLSKEGISESELDEHITKLHEYNEIKDVTQMVLGQLAMLEGVTVAELHHKFNLDLKE